MRGHPKVVRALLLQGANPESKGVRGMTALHYASCNGQNQVVELLLDSGSSVHGTADGMS